MMKTALSIAGSDSSGGAGIQADIKTMIMHDVYAMTAITALTAQNTTGVRDISIVTPEFLKEELDAVFEDIFPDAVKIGMIGEASLAKVAGERLNYYNARNIVLDPVMVATSGSTLSGDRAVSAIKKELMPISTLVTPNIPEGEVLSEMKIENSKDMEKAAEYIGKTYSCAVLLKGGHSIENTSDLLYDKGEFTWFFGERIDNPNTHGTGCTLSSAIASNLAKGMDVKAAVKNAKNFISEILKSDLNLGKGPGPLDHGVKIRRKSRF